MRIGGHSRERRAGVKWDWLCGAVFRDPLSGARNGDLPTDCTDCTDFSDWGGAELRVGVKFSGDREVRGSVWMIWKVRLAPEEFSHDRDGQATILGNAASAGGI
jgi:hypothetical protein